MARADFPALGGWLAAEHVRAWWRGVLPAPSGIDREFGPQADGTDPTRSFVLLLAGEPAGLFQCYRHADYPAWDSAVGVPGAAGLDYLIGEPGHCGQGIGTAAISAFTSVVFGLFPEVITLASVPQKENRASCRALEKAGFTLLGERDVVSDDPSDSGISSIYVLPRARPVPAGGG
ncbi:GNAT family N-acetyltransferase [Streptomyces sp. MST-110588]|nr:GNAT family N-acetyltransferase [Streptomyces sp. MST-110588]